MLTPEQVVVKGTGIGSSQVAALAGINPWATPIDVWLLATGRAAFNSESSVATEVGSLLEPALVQLYARRRPIDPGRLVQPHSTFRHPDHSYALASPDVFVMDGEQRVGLVELKVVGSRMAAEWEDGVPQYVRAQVAWQQFVLGIDTADVAALIDGTNFQIYTLVRDAETEVILHGLVEEFWRQYVETDTPPPPAPTESRREYLAKKFRGGRPDVIQVDDPHVIGLVMQYRAAKDVLGRAEAALEAVEAELKEIIGDCAGIAGNWGRASWAPQQGAPAYKAIAEALAPMGVIPPALLEQHRGKGFRKFQVYGPPKSR